MKIIVYSIQQNDSYEKRHFIIGPKTRFEENKSFRIWGWGDGSLFSLRPENRDNLKTIAMRKLLLLFMNWFRRPVENPKDVKASSEINYVTFEEYFKEDKNAYQQ